MSNVKKNQEFDIDITDINEEGLGVGRHEDFIWFVKDTAPGDRIRAAATKVMKNYGYARLVRVISASPYRTDAVCPVAGPCGGCQLQHIEYSAQLALKEKKVRDCLKRIGGMDVCAMEAEGTLVFESVTGMEHPWQYRNKSSYPIGRDSGGRLTAGFYAGRTHSLISCDSCLIGAEENTAVIRSILQHMNQYGIDAYDEKTCRGLIRHVMIRRTAFTGEILVCIVINGHSIPGEKELGQTLTAMRFDGGNKRNPAVVSVSVSENTAATNVIMGKKYRVIAGKDHIEEEILNRRFRISPLSFFQVNSIQMEKLYSTVLEYAGLTGRETVWDLYCGAGTISLCMAPHSKKVYGVEIVPEAVKDAVSNAALNGTGNVEFCTGKAEEVLPEWHGRHPDEKIDVIVTDPPRKGIDIKCLRTMLDMSPERIVYVSCNPSTLARDLRILSDGGYAVRRVRPVDMFPQTVHVECVVEIQRVHP